MKVDTEKVRLLMESRGLSKAALSRIAGITRATIYNILRTGVCRRESACVIAMALGVPLKEIAKEE